MGVFGFFGRSKKERLIDECRELLRYQIEAMETDESRSRLHSPFAYGYIFGFADAFFMKERVADADRLGNILALFESLFGPKAGVMASEWCLAAMHDQDKTFITARVLGGEEIFQLINSRGEKIPTGLGKYLLDG